MIEPMLSLRSVVWCLSSHRRQSSAKLWPVLWQDFFDDWSQRRLSGLRPPVMPCEGKNPDNGAVAVVIVPHRIPLLAGVLVLLKVFLKTG